MALRLNVINVNTSLLIILNRILHGRPFFKIPLALCEWERLSSKMKTDGNGIPAYNGNDGIQ